jgi:hypothetical protein
VLQFEDVIVDGGGSNHGYPSHPFLVSNALLD